MTITFFKNKQFSILSSIACGLEYIFRVLHITVMQQHFPLLYGVSTIVPFLFLAKIGPLQDCVMGQTTDPGAPTLLLSYGLFCLLGYGFCFLILFVLFFTLEMFYITTYSVIKNPGTGVITEKVSPSGKLSATFDDIFFSCFAIAVSILMVVLLIYERLLSVGFVFIDGLDLLYGTYTPMYDLASAVALQSVFGFFSIFTDPLSVLFLILTVVLLPVCVTVISRFQEEGLPLLLSGLFVTLLSGIAFLTTNFFIFFVAFEFILLPMFFIIGQWGSRSERTVASYMLYLYTLVGSIFFLTTLIVFVRTFADCNYFRVLFTVGTLSDSARYFIWFLLFAGFAFKIPLFPVHSWLTSAHVEAPTLGSILLAGILLKLGGYGLVRYVIVLFPDITQANRTAVISVCMLGLWYASICAYRQLDIKRFIAFTSIAHMQFLVASLLGGTAVGYVGAIHGMFSHGVVAAALFFLVGSLYERTGVRTQGYITGLLQVQPVFATLWTIFLMANAGVPLLSGFPSEFFGFTSLMCSSSVISFFGILSFVLCGGYSFLGQVRLTCGFPTLWQALRFAAPDVSRREFWAIFFLFLWSLILGIWPDVVCSVFDKQLSILPGVGLGPATAPELTEFFRNTAITKVTWDPFTGPWSDLAHVKDLFIAEFTIITKIKIWTFEETVGAIFTQVANRLSLQTPLAITFTLFGVFFFSLFARIVKTYFVWEYTQNLKTPYTVDEDSTGSGLTFYLVFFARLLAAAMLCLIFAILCTLVFCLFF